MSLIQINEDLCKQDGFCVQECPMAIIRQQDEKSFPQMVPGGDQLCISCGHCVAVCPHGAFDHIKVPLESCPPVEKELVINREQAVQFLRSRRSIRNFKSKPLGRETIQELIQLARYAPTGSNVQTVTWTVFTNQGDLKKLSEMTIDWMRKVLNSPNKAGMPPYLPMLIAGWDIGMDTILRNAPALVIASTPGEAKNGIVDLSIALTYLELIAPTSGLGTCWAGLLQLGLLYSKPLREFAGLPTDHLNHYPMMLGYPKFRYHRMPERKEPVITWRE